MTTLRATGVRQAVAPVAGYHRSCISPGVSSVAAPVAQGGGYTGGMSASRPPNPLLELAGRALEEALNRGLALDAGSAARLQGLEGRAVELTWTAADLGLRLRVDGGRLAVGPRESAEPDLSLRSSLAGLVGLAFPRLAESGFPGGKVQMSGDAELARRLAQLADKFAPDLDGAFARAFGDALGPQLARGVRGAFDWARGSARTLAEDAAVFVRDERGDTPARDDVREFLDDVDALRDRVERLAARIAALALSPERES